MKKLLILFAIILFGIITYAQESNEKSWVPTYNDESKAAPHIEKTDQELLEIAIKAAYEKLPDWTEKYKDRFSIGKIVYSYYNGKITSFEVKFFNLYKQKDGKILKKPKYFWVFKLTAAYGGGWEAR